ncbi:MAG: WecB/TagA/CpsF family glycosyltransferase [Synechococcaceae cyanobacterium]|nr:WecB/TagA/CpsF family glycosyltransferase [Synechococcaceae cyanobacterium]
MAATATAPVRTRVLGIPVDVCDVRQRALDLAQSGGQIVTLNAEMTMAALDNRDLRSAIEQADLIIPDGAGVVWALARQGHRVQRSPGIELARWLLEQAAANAWQVALVGASPEVLTRLCQRLHDELPSLRLVFTADGYRSSADWPDVERQLLTARPDLVLVALGVPRQETWIASLPRPLTGLWMGVGGSFDVWAGDKRRAPGWMRSLHAEWLYRLIKEPTRWRRMLALPAFAREVLRRG